MSFTTRLARKPLGVSYVQLMCFCDIPGGDYVPIIQLCSLNGRCTAWETGTVWCGWARQEFLPFYNYL